MALQREPSAEQRLIVDFANYATVGKYVRSILVLPADSPAEKLISEALSRAANDTDISWSRRAEEADGYFGTLEQQAVEPPQAEIWIQFPLSGGAYSPTAALAALEQVLEKKLKKYDGRQTGDLRLIIHYDQAVIYNSPFQDERCETFRYCMRGRALACREAA